METQHGRYVRVMNTENIYVCTKTQIYYLVEQVNRKRSFRSTGVKGEVEVEQTQTGRFVAKAIRGLGAAKNVIKDLRRSKDGHGYKYGRPAFSIFSDITLEIQRTKAPRTLAIAHDADKNLRPFFEMECPFLDTFERNYEQVWARYQKYKSEIKPGVKLGHDRKYLIMVLRRARKQRVIETDFIKSDFPLNEVSKPVGRALEDWEVRALLEASLEMGRSKPGGDRWGNIKIHQQILLAVYLGMRKSEILGLRVEEVNLHHREIDLDPKRIKTRKPRAVPIPIHNDVFPILKKLVSEAEGPFLFPWIDCQVKGTVIDWNRHQADLSSVFQRVRRKAKVQCRFHDLRHTAITNKVQAHVPNATISKIMGCSGELVTKIYDHLNKKTKEDLRSLYEGKFIS